MVSSGTSKPFTTSWVRALPCRRFCSIEAATIGLLKVFEKRRSSMMKVGLGRSSLLAPSFKQRSMNVSSLCRVSQRRVDSSLSRRAYLARSKHGNTCDGDRVSRVRFRASTKRCWQVGVRRLASFSRIALGTAVRDSTWIERLCPSVGSQDLNLSAAACMLGFCVDRVGWVERLRREGTLKRRCGWAGDACEAYRQMGTMRIGDKSRAMLLGVLTREASRSQNLDLRAKFCCICSPYFMQLEEWM